MNKLVVIARYNENLDWVNNLGNPVIIYNKGNDFQYNFPRIDVPNKGREPETYLRSIIENYHLLSNFSHVVFLQGWPHDHFSLDLKSYIDNVQSDEEMKFVSEGIGWVQTQNNIFVNHIQIQLLKSLLTDNYTQENGSTKCVFLLNLLGIEIQEATWEYACGAQYIVRVDKILSKSLEWWKSAYRIYDYYIKYNSGDPALLFEFIWPMIWMYEEAKCSKNE